MLLEFKVKNYKSFVDEANFSMIAASKQKGLDYSLYKKRLKGRLLKVLCSSVIYGPNAAGKTNVIGAMDVFRSIVLRGHIRNSAEKYSPNPAATLLEFIPNNGDKVGSPVFFSIDFMEQNLRICYNVTIDLGTFLDGEYERKIIEERLTVNGDMVFLRTDTLILGELRSIKKYLSSSVKTNREEGLHIAKNSLISEELFLTNGFKSIFSPIFVKLIIDWLTHKFIVIYRADCMQLVPEPANSKKKALYIEQTTNSAAKIFGINSNEIGYLTRDDDSEAKLCSIFKNIRDKKGAVVPAELFESYGTIRFVHMFPLVLQAIHTGATLVIDEFDASIHPMALMSIINIFHNDEINIHHAQLIFNTHNPIFLNSNIFRRDEIKFVERDDEKHCSTLYTLSDFGTSGEKGVRKQEDYMKNYFINQYGAIKNIDFTSLFEEAFSTKGQV